MKEQAKKVHLCDCGEAAIVATKRNDPLKYLTLKPTDAEWTPDLRRRLKLCLTCWCRWEDEFGHRQTASAIWIG